MTPGDIKLNWHVIKAVISFTKELKCQSPLSINPDKIFDSASSSVNASRFQSKTGVMENRSRNMRYLTVKASVDGCRKVRKSGGRVFLGRKYAFRPRSRVKGRSHLRPGEANP